MSLVLNGTLEVAGAGICAATPAWPGKSNHSVVWDFDISLLPGGDSACTADDITIAYHHGQLYSYRYSIPAWWPGTCEYESGSFFTLSEFLSRDVNNACGMTEGTDLAPCHGYVGQLSEFAADHVSHDRFMCDHRSMGLWAATTCGGPVTLLISVYERTDGEAQAFCERYEGNMTSIISLIIGSLVGFAVIGALLGFAYDTDSGFGRCLRNAERGCCSAVTLRYLSGAKCCVAKCMPKDEEAVRESWSGSTGRDCADSYGECLDRVCICCTKGAAKKVQSSTPST
jgi:hypothetical protein